jgi:hypothetical protein
MTPLFIKSTQQAVRQPRRSDSSPAKEVFIACKIKAVVTILDTIACNQMPLWVLHNPSNLQEAS